MVHKPRHRIKTKSVFVSTKRMKLVVRFDHYWCIIITIKIDGLLTDTCYQNAIVRSSVTYIGFSLFSVRLSKHSKKPPHRVQLNNANNL